MSDEPKYLDVETWGDETCPCCVCGDEIEDGDQVVWEPWDDDAPRRMVSPAHPGCSVSNGYRLRYPGEAKS